MATRSEELRQLKDELIPAQLKDQSPWHVFIDPNGELEAQAKLGHWDAALTVDSKSTHSDDAVPARRLGLPTQVVVMETVFASILCVAMTVLTAVYRASKPLVGRLLWIIHSGLAGVECGAT